MPSLVISLDFELFWGVVESRSINNYQKNIKGERTAIPKILDLFKRYGIRATWATVGMLMCRDYSQWCEIRPSILPSYHRAKCSSYILDAMVRDNPNLFFARSLVESILDASEQEVASHSYSHFFCGEPGATPEQFAADLICASEIGAELGIQYRSFVFPRNQIKEDYLKELLKAGYSVFRGNKDYWLYRDGHSVVGGIAGRSIRMADAYLPISSNQFVLPPSVSSLVDVPASYFLRPWSTHLSAFESIRLSRIKNAMTAAALEDGVFHLWWHPHNFGVNIDENLAVLESLLQHYICLRDKYGMKSSQMSDFAPEAVS